MILIRDGAARDMWSERTDNNLRCKRSAKDVEVSFMKYGMEHRSEIQLGKLRKLTDMCQTSIFIGTGKNLEYKWDRGAQWSFGKISFKISSKISILIIFEPYGMKLG